MKMKIIIENIAAVTFEQPSLVKPIDVRVDHYEVDYLVIINGKTQLKGKIATNMENKTFDDLKQDIRNNLEIGFLKSEGVGENS